jgi:hypothetical protein
MTDRHDERRYYDGGRGEERLLREALRGFHLCVSAEDALDPVREDRWRALAPPRLCRAAGVDLTAEAAWALLARWEGTTDLDGAAADDSPTLARGLIAAMPPLTAWLRYVEQFPAGEAMAELRRDRREAILRWISHVHPDPSALAGFAHDDPALPSLLRAGIAAHIRGPYNCLACRSAARERSPASQQPGTSQRLAAATVAHATHSHEAIVNIRGVEYRLHVRFLADGDFLRVFASYGGQRTLPRTAMQLAVFALSGQVREGRIIYPDHGLTGVNLGPLQGFPVDDIVSFCLEP